jgi:Zn-dependent peptidase ImmA (M78 family)
MGYRWGFKSEANATAREIRAELGLKDLDMLDPRTLAGHLLIPITPLSAYDQDAPGAVRYFTETDQGAFSACTVFDGTRRVVVHNDAHLPGRQASNLAHELAHALLLHPPTPALDDRGCRLWNQDIEDEAAWLAGALLLTEDATLWIARNSISIPTAAERFGISEQMVNYRLNMTGARTRVARTRRLRVVRDR